jgi:hypothetical protein
MKKGLVLIVALPALLLLASCTIGPASSSTDLVETEDATLPTVAVTESPTPAPQKDTFGVGESAELNDIIVTLKSVEENTGKDFFEPSDGKVFVLCEFEIENDSDSEINISSLMSFDAYVDDYSTSMNLSAQMTSDKTQLDGTIAAGKKMAGAIGYEVPYDWKVLEISFTPDFWDGTDIKFIAESGN